jgi:hypothetical protein
MNRAVRAALWWVGISALALVAACGSSGSSGGGSGTVHVINATRNHASIDVLNTGTAAVSAVAKDGISAGTSLAAASYSLQITDSGSQTALASIGPSVVSGENEVLLAYESNGTVKAWWFSLTTLTPASGAAGLRVLNAAVDAGSLAVYVTASGVDLTTVSPTFTTGGQGKVELTSYASIAAGTYQVRVTANGNPADLRLNIPSVTLTSQHNADILLTPTAGGVLVDGGFLDEPGTYTAFRNTSSRVRVAPGVAGAQVAVSVGLTTVQPSALSPFITGYNTVPAGSAVWTVTVNGNAAAVPPITLTAGSDYTLLVSGTASAAAAALVADDNHGPVLATNAKLRLVNATSGSNAGLSMTANFVLIDSGVLPGTAGPYTEVPGDANNMRLEVSTPLSPTSIYLQSGLNVPNGGTYSVFVLGDSSAPITVVRRDH